MDIDDYFAEVEERIRRSSVAVRYSEGEYATDNPPKGRKNG